MRQDKFRVIDENNSWLLCKNISLLPRLIGSQEVEVHNHGNYHIGDVLLIEYNEYSSNKSIPEGKVIADSNQLKVDKELTYTGMYNARTEIAGPSRFDTLQWTTREQERLMERVREFDVRVRPEMFDWKPKQKPTEEKEMQNHLVELLAKNFYTIGISFEHSSKVYTYKVALDIELEVDDKVIVDITSGLTIVNVIRVDKDASGIDLTMDVKYKFIVQKLDTTQYDELCEKDKSIGKVIAQGAAERARRELIESYTGNLNEEQIKALEDCGVTSVKRLE